MKCTIIQSSAVIYFIGFFTWRVGVIYLFLVFLSEDLHVVYSTVRFRRISRFLNEHTHSLSSHA